MFKAIFSLGGALAVAGIVCYASAFGSRDSEAFVSIASGLFSLGALIIALGFYLQARRLRAEVSPRQQQQSGAKKTDRLCASCNREAARVFCRVHQLRLCMNCVDAHDDGRNCLYVPGNRAAAAYK